MRDLPHSYEYHRERRRDKRRFGDDEPLFQKRQRHVRGLPPVDANDATDGLPEGDRWSTWDQPNAGERGPEPYPDWLVTELAAVDTELGILKTGKEADVFLLRRGVPQTGPSCLLAAKRYRDAGHRMFHRDSGYVEGRRVRGVPDQPGHGGPDRVRPGGSGRAVGRGRVRRRWSSCPGAVSRSPTRCPCSGPRCCLEFIGEPDGTGAPRLAELRPAGARLAALWDQLVEAVVTLARHGLAHGDLSAYNLLVQGDRLVMIDLPQVVDVIANPQGAVYLERDADNVAAWFTARGLADVARARGTGGATPLRGPPRLGVPSGAGRGRPRPGHRWRLRCVQEHRRRRRCCWCGDGARGPRSNRIDGATVPVMAGSVAPPYR